ncbi:ABC transporter permease [Rhodococcus koreensis]
MNKSAIIAWRLAILAMFLFAWEYLPQIAWLQTRVTFLDPFFISSPSAIAERMFQLTTGASGGITIWPYILRTLGATLVGTAIGIVLGLIMGLLLSSSKPYADVLGFYINALNSVPRIALIPVIILLAGVGFTTSVVSGILVVFFLAFFNAFEGGTRVPAAVLANAKVMGASRARILGEIRFRYVLLWTFAAIPNAIAFGLLMVVASELLSGTPGIGQLMLLATSNLDASLTFSVVVFLSVIGTGLLVLAESLKGRLLHWADGL